MIPLPASLRLSYNTYPLIWNSDDWTLYLFDFGLTSVTAIISHFDSLILKLSSSNLLCRQSALVYNTLRDEIFFDLDGDLEHLQHCLFTLFTCGLHF